MIDIDIKRIDSILEEVVRNMGGKETQLVVVTKKVQAIDPIRFFERAKKLEENRVFWASADGSFCVAGVGEQIEITTTHTNDQQMNHVWNELTKQAVVYNPYNVIGTGLFAIGGMDFDPLSERTTLWKNFKPNQFIVPKYFITRHMDSFFYTVSLQVNKSANITELVEELAQVEAELLDGKEENRIPATVAQHQVIEPEQWRNTVQLAVDEIKKDKFRKVVLARELRLKLDKEAEIGSILNRLLTTQPNSYVFAFEKQQDCFLGATPERLVKVEGNQLFSTCLAGTAARGQGEKEDAEIAMTELLNDEKNLEEHGYVVKMIQDAITPYCTDIKIADAPIVLTLKNLQHLYTPVSAQLKKEFTIFDIIYALHPTPALGGVPTDKSLQFIRDYELLDRGWYGAPVGWLDGKQNGEFAVAIRSGLIQGEEASLFAGCGVMKDSDPWKEFEETSIKFLPMLSVLGG